MFPGALPVCLVIFVAFMPIANVAYTGAPSVVFYLTVFVALCMAVINRFENLRTVLIENKALFVGMAIPVFAVLFSSLVNGSLSGRDFESALRFFIGPFFVLLAMQYVPSRLSKHIIWGFLLAALYATWYVLYRSYLNDWGRPHTGFVYNAVGYGSYALLLAAISLFSIRWQITPFARAEKILKVVVFIAVFAAAVVTQTRTAWLTVPAFVIVGVILFSNKLHARRIVVSTLAILAVMAGLFVSNNALKQRAIEGYNQVRECVSEKRTANTSLCIRIQLWRASIGMFEKRPVAGMGRRDLFNPHLKSEALPEGVVSEYTSGWGEPHNDHMLALASYGLPGGLGFLAVYLVPGLIFARRMSFSNPVSIRTAAAIGLAYCLGMLFFGMGETMFRSMRTVAFYGVGIGAMMHLSSKRSQTL